MNILMASSELAPFARTGALGDSMLSLSSELANLGHEVSVALPYYREIKEDKKWKVKSISARLNIPMGNQRRSAEIFETRAPNGVQVFLVRRDEYFDRSGLYGANGEDYQDNAERFIFFTKCVVELTKRLEPAPQILHAQDWQTALLPLFAKAQQLPFGTAFTIHDLAYQGNFWSYDFALTNLSAEWFSTKGAEFYGSMNCVKGGVAQADAVIVDGAPFAHAIQTSEQGCGLDAVFRENAWKLHGIPSGLDDALWNPASDRLLPKTFDAIKLEGKRACREALLKQTALSPSPASAVLIMDIRESVAVSLLLPALDRLLAADVRLILTGKADSASQTVLKTFLLRHREKMASVEEPDETFSHLAYAGADILLLPATVKTGKVLLVASKYGAVPLAQATGGLREIVQDYDPSTTSGNGFVFYEATAEAFLDAVRHALNVFGDPPRWKAIVQSGMRSDFSWTACAKSHEALYQKIARPVPASPSSR